MPSESTLTLFIPDLFDFQSTFSKLSKDELSQLPDIKCPVLEKWISRGKLEKEVQQKDPVFSEFGLSLNKNNDTHYASLTLLAENAADIELVKNSYWLRADPVNIQPDRDSALLAAYEEMSLTQDEADKLVTQINAHFIDEPWQLYTFAPHRWYLRLDNKTDLTTFPVMNVMGEDVNQFMFSGKDKDYWFKITNELQMLLHGTNVNFERESRNLLTVNSVWLWGGGASPELHSNKQSGYDQVITNNTLFSGLARYCECALSPLSRDLIKNIESGNHFIVLDALSALVQRRDLYSFVEKLNEIENDFLHNINELLENGKINRVKLISNNGITFTVTKKHLHRWWKRIKPFSGFNYA